MAETKYKQTEIGLIPEDWEVTSLGKVCAVKGRIGFRGYTRKDLVDESNGAITLSPANIIDGILSFENCTYISWYKYFESPEIMAELGDIVFTKTASVGKTALIRTLPKETTINPQLVLLKNISCNSAFLSYILQDIRFQNDVKAETGQGCVPNVPQSVLEKIEVPLPPLAEQHAIASALTSVDNLIASLDKQIAKTQNVKQGAMQQLLTGLNTEDVTWKPLHECLGYEQPARYIVKSSDYYDAGVPVLTAGQSFILGYTKETYGVFEASRECPVIIFDDFTTSFHWVEFRFKVKSSAMKMLRPISKDISFKYVHYAMNCINYEPVEHSRQWISMYSKFTIPIPSIETQHRIASALTAIDDQISALEAKRRKYEMVKVGMMQQLLTGRIRLT